MKTHDDHTHRTGATLVLKPREAGLGFDSLIRNLRIVAGATEKLGAWLDYNETLIKDSVVEACLVLEHERTTRPGLRRDKSYRYLRDDEHAERVLANKVKQIAGYADHLGFDVIVGATYHETL
jgi:hypothetical protein